MTSKEMSAKAEELRVQATDLSKQAMDLHRQELLAKPLTERMVYAAYSRCPCGAGLAYDPAFEDQESVFNGPLSGHWDCSAIMLGTADTSKKHTDKMPFAFYEVKSEGQPSANGATTRPKGGES